jgi:hypothetical protein
MRNVRKLFAHTMLLHHTKELDNNLGARSDEDLALSSLLCIVDGVERIVEDRSLDHLGGLRFSDRRTGNEVSTSNLYVSLHEL